MQHVDDHEQRPLTPKTLAARSLCSERHIRNLITRGDLPAFKVGERLLRIKWADVTAFERRSICERRRSSKEQPANQ